MATDFKLPDVGEGIHEGEVVSWLVDEGDEVEEDQPLVEVGTDKAVVEIPSPVAGTVLSRHGEEGEIVNVGETIIVIGDPEEDVGEEVQESYSQGEGDEAAKATQAVMEGDTGDTGGDGVVDAPKRPGGRALATPSTRRLARELEVDINTVNGTGPAGRVTDEDVRRATEGAPEPAEAAEEEAPAPQPTPQAVPSPTAEEAPEPKQPQVVERLEGEEPEKSISISSVRRSISDRMSQSKYTAPHVTHFDEVDMTELVALREEMKPLAQEKDAKLTYLPFIVKAVVAALKQYPRLNATFDHDNGEIVEKHYYHMGIATATDAGLMVPVVRHADRKSLLQLARDIRGLATQARERSIALDDLKDSTFTITSIGSIGGTASTPIINYPEVAILAVHRIDERPVVRDGEITVRKMTNLALSFDHRVVDGDLGARFTNQVIAYLENPTQLFMEMV